MLPTTSVATLKSAGINVYTGPALTYRTFIINSSPNKTEHRELLDPKVRDVHGKLHIIPNGQIKNVVNFSKGYVNAVVDFKAPTTE